MYIMHDICAFALITKVYMSLAALSEQDPAWYSLLTGHLSPEQAVQVQEMFIVADKRTAARGILHSSYIHVCAYVCV